ncbi:MAG TPA: acyl-CoA dehydrogenase family protein [Micromonosporaceae bacterium]|nr:acyl-CoA dehydrogenase family protein [Micromonosporaceae bacterium]
MTATAAVAAPARRDYAALAHELAPVFAERAAHYDAASEFPSDNFDDLVRSGYTAMTVPTRYGGGGATLAQLCQAQEILAAACGSTAFAVNMHVHGLAMIAQLDDPRYEWIFRAVVDDGAVIAGGFSEPGVGGNWWYPTSTAELVDGGYRVSGRKSFFTGFPGATLLFLSAALPDPLGLPMPVGFLIPRPARGLEVTATWDAAGMRATGSHSLRVDNLVIPARYRIGDEGELPMIFLRGVHWAWCSFASVFLGIARGAADLVASTQRERRLQVIDRPLAHLPGIQFKVADMVTRLAAAQAYLSAAIAANHDIDEDPLGHYVDMSLMKVTVCRLAHEIVTLAMQVQGGSGLVSASPLQRMYRDVVAGLLVPPTPDLVQEWAGKRALGVPVLDEPRWEG